MRNTKLPRITKCLQWQAILSRSEARCVIEGQRRNGVCFSEAVVHYTSGTGETAGLIGAAIRNRQIVREIRGSLSPRKEVSLTNSTTTTAHGA